MNYRSSIAASSGMALLFFGSLNVLAAPLKLAQSSDINVQGPTVNCGKVQASAPNVGVSVPNVSRLVPNVGKLLREGIGVPAPDAEAPDISAPRVSASAPDQSCDEVQRTNSSAPMQNSNTPAPVSGLW